VCDLLFPVLQHDPESVVTAPGGAIVTLKVAKSK
jgi:hypothetical protein